MKRSFACLLIAALVGFAGCNNKSTPGGPGTSNRGDNKPVVGQTDASRWREDLSFLAAELPRGARAGSLASAWEFSLSAMRS